MLEEARKQAGAQEDLTEAAVLRRSIEPPMTRWSTCGVRSRSEGGKGAASGGAAAKATDEARRYCASLCRRTERSKPTQAYNGRRAAPDGG